MTAHLRLDNVSVSFPIFDVRTRSLKQHLIASATGGRIGFDTKRHVSIQALENISLDLTDGARIGLVGHNGAGKSTLLRVLAGIYEPQSGTVDIQGKITPLFDIGLGMDMMSTGYENILLRGLYLGLSRKNIQARIAEIAEFSELGGFLDMPLHSYSAGMHARLAFSISTCVEPQILLMDEGIGTSDSAFLNKARARLAGFADQASIVVIASHRESLLRDLCEHLIFIEHGKIAARGTMEEIVQLMRAKGQSLR
jgi:ABC-2 type transport system ATP-binding protein/lipopolysaccharide transport system ATP-binding protein